MKKIEFLNLLQRMIHALKQLKLEYVVVGGVAVIIKGEPRTTRDVDVIVEPDVNRENLLHSFQKKDFEFVQDPFTKLKNNSMITILDKQSSLTVDLKVAKSEIDQLALTHKQFYTYKGLKIPIPSPEIILLGKLIYLGDITNEKRTFLLKISDVTDFTAVFNRNKQKIDKGWLKKKAKQYGLERSLQRLLDLAEEVDTQNY